jgi:uncharacterized membrane protein
MKKLLWFCISVFIFELIIGACLYSALPTKIPMHWNSNGVADKFGGRWTIFIVPIITSFMIFIFIGLMAVLMKKKENIRRSEKVVVIAVILMQMVYTGIFVWVILTVKEISSSYFTIDKIVLALTGIMFIVIGNYMPKIKQNSDIGVRTPWTLKNPVVWQKSQRFGGLLLMTAGVLFILSFLLPRFLNMIIPTVYTVIIGLVMYLHSYLVYVKETKK